MEIIGEEMKLNRNKTRYTTHISLLSILCSFSVGFSTWLTGDFSSGLVSDLNYSVGDIELSESIEDLGISLSLDSTYTRKYITYSYSSTNVLQNVSNHLSFVILVDMTPKDSPLSLYNLDYDDTFFSNINFSLTFLNSNCSISMLNIYPYNYPYHTFEVPNNSGVYYFPLKSKHNESLYNLAKFDKTFPLLSGGSYSYKVPIAIDFEIDVSKLTQLDLSGKIIYNLKISL